jgi:outer membrane biogenesis lipoprotein LolB
MSRNLKMATVAVLLAFAATGAAQARGNFDRDSHAFAQAQTQSTHPGYQAHGDLGVRGYGCLSHPDYGLYTRHFC